MAEAEAEMRTVSTYNTYGMGQLLYYGMNRAFWHAQMDSLASQQIC